MQYFSVIKDFYQISEQSFVTADATPTPSHPSPGLAELMVVEFSLFRASPIQTIIEFRCLGITAANKHVELNPNSSRIEFPFYFRVSQQTKDRIPQIPRDCHLILCPHW